MNADTPKWKRWGAYLLMGVFAVLAFMVNGESRLSKERTVRYNEQTFKLERMQQLLAKLGNPHQQIRTVHVAGTNGKGSTVSMIASASNFASAYWTSGLSWSWNVSGRRSVRR